MRNLLDCFDCAKWLSGQDVQQCFLWCFKKACHMMAPVLNIGGQTRMWITWVIHRSSVTTHRVAQLERATTTLSLSITVPSALAKQRPVLTAEKCLAWLELHAPSPYAVEVFYKADISGWCHLPGCHRSALTWCEGSMAQLPQRPAAAAVLIFDQLNLKYTLKIQVSIEASNNFSFTKTRMLATVLEFHVEYFSVRVRMCTLLFAISA